MKVTRLLFLLILIVFFVDANAQEKKWNDSTKVLNEVVVKAYSHNRPMLEIPTSVGLIDTKALERFSNTSLLPAVNTIPGVRFEERSPGSYRLAIRGSSLRSPFGVRNVKIYWNGLPLTDGGGNTYLNLIDFSSVDNIEIIKGPGASMYGAGTGGVILLNGVTKSINQYQFSSVAGSFGLLRYNASAQVANKMNSGKIGYAHQQSNGYREQTNMTRDAVNLDLNWSLSSQSNLATTVLYSDLFYQTPGGLTKVEYDLDPRQARPTVGKAVGAVAQQARVNNKTGYVGLLHEYEFNNHWTNKTGVYGSYSQFINPSIRNFEIRKETNWGARSETHYSFEKNNWNGKVIAGGEFQNFNSPVTDYDNNLGQQGNVQVDDKLSATTALLFVQTDFNLPNNLFLTVGASSSYLRYSFERLSDSPTLKQIKNFDPVISPRIALLKKLSQTISIYGSYSQGFSTPTLAEVRPSTNTFNALLNAERGNNLELGIKGSVIKQLQFELTAYQFKLDQTIVIQRAADGADYYVNAGNTLQRGVEAFARWSPKILNKLKRSSFNVWSSYTFNPYKFENYITTGKDYSGNKLTGTALNTFIAGLDFAINRFYLNSTFNYTSAIALNDANTDFANEYYLLGSRIGYKPTTIIEIFGGADNILNQRYSPGNDLNAAAGRYYNAAAGRNIYAGIKVTLAAK